MNNLCSGFWSRTRKYAFEGCLRDQDSPAKPDRRDFAPADSFIRRAATQPYFCSDLFDRIRSSLRFSTLPWHNTASALMTLYSMLNLKSDLHVDLQHGMIVHIQ